MEIYRNEYFKIHSSGEQVFIETFASGFPIKDFQIILNEYPRIGIKSFAILRQALDKPDSGPKEFGYLKPRIEITLAKDEMSAEARLYLTPNELAENGGTLHSQLVDAMRQQGVVEGYLEESLQGPWEPNRAFTVAIGQTPVQGTTAEVRYYDMSAVRPQVNEDDSVDFFDMNYIDEVKQGDWLGEYIPPTDGKSGFNVKGTLLPAQKGKDKVLLYDPLKVAAVEEDGRTVLRAMTQGLVDWKNDRITIQDCLCITGDVGPETGNIKYIGNVRISGTVLDRYSVIATEDIAIWGLSGVGAAQQIISEQGSIYIKGGLFGNGKTEIKANKDVYVKSANDCIIEAGENLYIQQYSIGCDLTARKVLLDKKHGRIIGGTIKAELKVTSSTTGNEMERPTNIQVWGFNRNQVKRDLEMLLVRYKAVMADMNKVDSELDLYSSYVDSLNEEELQNYTLQFEKRHELEVHLRELEQERRMLMSMLKIRGEGEVGILSKAFPKTILQLKEVEKRIEHSTAGYFYVNNHELHIE